MKNISPVIFGAEIYFFMLSDRMTFIKHTKRYNMFRVCCNEVLLGGAYIRMFKDLFVISYKIPPQC